MHCKIMCNHNNKRMIATIVNLLKIVVNACSSNFILASWILSVMQCTENKGAQDTYMLRILRNRTTSHMKQSVISKAAHQQTKQPLCKCMSPHRRAKPSGQDTAVYLHLKDTDHTFEDSEMKILDKEHRWFQRGVKEAISQTVPWLHHWWVIITWMSGFVIHLK